MPKEKIHNGIHQSKSRKIRLEQKGIRNRRSAGIEKLKTASLLIKA